MIHRIKMFLKTAPLSVKAAVVMFFSGCALIFFSFKVRSHVLPEEKIPLPEPVRVAHLPKPRFVRGIHLTSWVTGSKKLREKLDDLFESTELNTAVIDVKEFEGEVYIPGVPMVEKYKLYTNAVPDFKDYLDLLKEKGIYTVARIVLFKDNKLPRKRNELAVKTPEGSLWQDRHRVTWSDPYNREVWEYNLSIASRAAEMGFDEIQFDYIRFPSDGDIKKCRYSYEHHNSSSADADILAFLGEASKRVKSLGVNLSIDVFGLTPSVPHDMGIGQKFKDMAERADFISPMVYPSHYAKGEYGIPDPNREPYKVVSRTLSDAKARLAGDVHKLRPYLQDFSLGVHYGPKEVQEQIQACESNGVKEWILWNPNCHYTREALKSKKVILQEEARIPETPVHETELQFSSSSPLLSRERAVKQHSE